MSTDPLWRRGLDWMRGGSGQQSLPKRVQQSIHAQQRRSEILTSLVQLAVVLGFGTLYVSAPMAQGQVQMLATIPAVLAIYIVITLFRLLLAAHDLLADWLVYLSSIIDMMLLVVTIWSFHLQYAQPAAFYLKAPTLLYFFIFIALRALRFQARFVIAAGISAALGWAALTLFVLSGIGGPAVITHDYVQYMTSNVVLVGAEIDKIVAMLTVTAILALAISRAQRLLVRSVSESQAARDLSRFFDPSIASRITGADLHIKPGDGELRHAAILTVDIRGFTALSAALPPAEVVRLLQEFQSRFCPIIQANGGVIDKFLGDGILASFGAVIPSPSCAADALRATDALSQSAVAWAGEHRSAGLSEIRIGIGIAAGEVVFGAIGDEARLEYTVIGDAVNLAAKLEAQNKIEGSIALCDAATFDLAIAQGYAPKAAVERLVQRQVGGMVNRLDLVVLARSS